MSATRLKSGSIFTNPQELFRIVCNIWQTSHAATRGAADQFGRNLAQLASANQVAEADHDRERLQALIATDEQQILPFDRAQFHFLSGYLDLKYHQVAEATHAFADALRYLPKADFASRVQLLLKNAAANMQIHNYKVSVENFSESLDIVQMHPQIRFSKGDLKSLTCHLYTQRAQAWLNLGPTYFHQAFRDSGIAVDLSNARCQKFHGVRSPGYMPDENGHVQTVSIISSHQLPPEIFDVTDSVTIAWLTIRNLVAWGRAYVLFWACRLDQAHQNGPWQDLHAMLAWLHREIDENMAVEVRRSDDYQRLPQSQRNLYVHTASLARFAVEAIFVLIEDDPQQGEEILRYVDPLLKYAKVVDHNTPEAERDPVFDKDIALLRLMCRHWQIELLAVQRGITLTDPLPKDLATKMRNILYQLSDAMPLDPQTIGMRQMQGRYYLAKARLLLRMQKNSAALLMLGEAHDIFSTQGSGGHSLRLRETEQLLFHCL